MVNDELGGFLVVLETELFGHEAKFYIWLVPGYLSATPPSVKTPKTYALHMLESAAKRSRSMNISIR